MTVNPRAADPKSLRVVGLRKRIADFTLEAELSLGAGQRAGLIGRSGSGKTTFLRLIAGLQELDASGDQGQIWIGERDVTRLPPEKRDIGVVFQDSALFPSLNLIDNVTFGLRMRGVAREERDAQAMAWLERVDLKSRAQADVTQLSGGEKQRAAFIRAVLFKPCLLLLDEPFSALDASMRGTLRRELVELHKLWPVPLLLVTHDEADLEAVATRSLRIQEQDSGARRSITEMVNQPKG